MKNSNTIYWIVIMQWLTQNNLYNLFGDVAAIIYEHYINYQIADCDKENSALLQEILYIEISYHYKACKRHHNYKFSCKKCVNSLISRKRFINQYKKIIILSYWLIDKKLYNSIMIKKIKDLHKQ